MLNDIKEDLCQLAITTYKHNRKDHLNSKREKELWELGERIEMWRNTLMYGDKVEMIEYEPTCD